MSWLELDDACSNVTELGYNAKGQLVTETVALAGAPQVPTVSILV